MSARGLFITLEGGEGGGKSTQSKRLKEALESAGHAVVLTREPGGTPEAEKIRTLLVDRAGGDWSAVAETLLLFAARAMHVRDCIAPALAAGKIVICDRFTDSTRAYQGYAGGMALQAIEDIKRVAIGDFEPDVSFILDIPAAIGLSRSNRRMAHTGATEDRFENKALEFHEKLRQGYLDIAAKNPARCHVIDATQGIDDILKHILAVIPTKEYK
jgi:dTMP kinase